MNNIKRALKSTGYFAIYAFAFLWNLPKKIKREILSGKPFLKSNRAVACALSVVMMITAIPLSGVVASSTGNTPVQDIVLNGDVYEIYTAQGLVKFGDKVNEGETAINGKIMNNIDLYSVCNSQDSLYWKPIGDKTNKYNGIFDGNNKEISNIYFHSRSKSFIALFGYTNTNAVIKNLNASGEFEAESSIAGIAIENNGTIDNCSFSGNVSAYNGNAGGIAATNNGTIKNCINSATVKITFPWEMEILKVFGGIVGINAGTVSGCINKGTFETTNGNTVGGIVGESQGDAKTINCYNLSPVTGQKIVGGIIGNLSAGTVENCYNTGTVTAVKGINFGGAIGANPNATVITNTYYLDNSVTNGVTPDGDAKTADEMKAAEFVILLNGADGTAFEKDIINDNDGYPILSYQKVTIEGDGTKDNPYLIYDARQLKYFGFLVNGGATTSNAKLMDHIDLSKVCGKELRGKEVNWIPIGTTSETNEYSGTFDGNNKTINYLYINSTQSNHGLFGYIGTTGIVKDIKVSGDIQCWGFSGGIASSNKGLIENCTFSGSINSGIDYLGGIAWTNLGTITKCTNNAKITGTGSDGKIGGIVGENTKEVSECINNGEIVCENGTNVGGIAGLCTWGPNIINCYNTAKVTGKTNVGGVVGQLWSGAIENCYNVGTVIGTTDFGGAVGTNPNSRTIINTYYLNTAVTGGVTPGGVAKSADEMKSADFLIALNGTGKVFAKDEANQNKGYPILAYLAMTLEGDGTIASPYLIYTAEELEYFSKIVNSGKLDSTAKLMADIDMSTVCGPNKGGVDVPWSSIGQIYPWYEGTFDGNNKTISNLHLDGRSGLFKNIDAYNSDGSIDEIKNLTISNVTSSVPLGDTGIICKDISGSMAKISNCKVIDSDVKVGGGFGSIAFKNEMCIISDCYSNIKMSTDLNAKFASAIAGICYSLGGGGKISGCTYDGEILINSPYANVEMVAGICGYNRNGDYIENCKNYANITITSDKRDNSYIGGIVGQATSDQTTAYVKNCHNYGNITGSGNYIGGIGGYLSVNTENCTNEGNILGGYNCIGGIAGGFGGDRTMKNCTTTGDLLGSFWMGGIVGYLRGTIDKCSNTGNIKVTSYEADFSEDCTGGGIVGVVEDTAIIKNSFNTGDVISEKAPDYTGNYNDHVGGFVGLDRGGSITIINCYSSGKLKAGLSAHPVLGQSQYGAPNITCTNSYFMNGVVEGTELYGATKASAEQFGSGEITVKLGDAFGQDITSATPDAFPQFLKTDNSNKVLTLSFKPFGGEITDSSYTNFNQKIKIPAAYNTGEYGFKTQDNKWVDETSVATTNLDITAIVKPSYTVTIPTGVDFGNVTRVLENKPESEKIIKTDLFSVDATHSNLFQNEKILTVSVDGSNLKMTNGTAITPFALYLEDGTVVNSLTNVFSLTSAEIDANVTQSKKFYAKLDQSQITANGKYTGVLTFTVAINDIA